MVEEQEQVAGRVQTGYFEAASPFVELSSKLFFKTPAPRTLAVVAATTGEGVSWFCRRFEEFLVQQMAFQVGILHASECLVTTEPDSCFSQESSFASHSSGFAISATLHSAALRSNVTLIDCPPLAFSFAALVLAPHVDGVLLVIEDGRHSKQEILSAVSILDSAHARVLGAVLNKRRGLLPPWLRFMFSKRRNDDA